MTHNDDYTSDSFAQSAQGQARHSHEGNDEAAAARGLRGRMVPGAPAQPSRVDDEVTMVPQGGQHPKGVGAEGFATPVNPYAQDTTARIPVQPGEVTAPAGAWGDATVAATGGAGGEGADSMPRGLGASGAPGWAPQPGAAETTLVQPPVNHARPKEKRTVGLGMALALMLVGSITAGTVTGVVVSRTQDQGSTNVVNALSEQPQIHRTATTTPGSVEEVAANVLPTVVSIKVATDQGIDEGSGSIISSDGYVLTNMHVVKGAATGGRTVVQLNDGRRFAADFVAGDASYDIAVIKLRGAEGLPVINFGNSDDVRVGQQVVAIGSPLGLSATVTSGIVSALNRPVRASGVQGGESSLIDAIQTDAAINPGNSGGPLVDMSGNLIGMNSVIASMAQGTGEAGSIGLGFAIPVSQARKIAQQLIDDGVVTTPKIGVRLAPGSRVQGALVGQVDAGSPAQEAGIGVGDVILAVDDRPTDSADALIAAIRSHNVGDTVTLKVANSDSPDDVREVPVTLS